MSSGEFNRGGHAHGARPARRGADVESEATISFAEALDGVTVSLRLTTDEALHGLLRHRGSGRARRPACARPANVHRAGRAQPARRLALSERLPRAAMGRGRAVDDALRQPVPAPAARRAAPPVGAPGSPRACPPTVARIRLKGKGAPRLEPAGPAGDLFIVVHVSADPVFGRAKDNVTVSVPVTFAEAALGADIPIPLPRGGKVTLKVPAGTANGRTFRVRGRGATRRDGTMGDLLATVEVAVPRALSDEARAALAAYVAAADEPDPRAHLHPSPRAPREAPEDFDDDTPVYAISIAASLAGLHPQTLRQYDRLGLVSPNRTGGRNRLYSMRDVARLREVQRLAADGVNLTGIMRILELEEHLDGMRRRLDALEDRERSTALVVWRPSPPPLTPTPHPADPAPRRAHLPPPNPAHLRASHSRCASDIPKRSIHGKRLQQTAGVGSGGQIVEGGSPWLTSSPPAPRRPCRPRCATPPAGAMPMSSPSTCCGRCSTSVTGSPSP